MAYCRFESWRIPVPALDDEEVGFTRGVICDRQGSGTDLPCEGARRRSDEQCRGCRGMSGSCSNAQIQSEMVIGCGGYLAGSPQKDIVGINHRPRKTDRALGAGLARNGEHTQSHGDYNKVAFQIGNYRWMLVIHANPPPLRRLRNYFKVAS